MEIGVKYYFTIRYNASSVAILMKHVSLLISSAKDKDDQFSEFLSSLASDPPSPMLEDFNFTSGEFLKKFIKILHQSVLVWDYLFSFLYKCKCFSCKCQLCCHSTGVCVKGEPPSPSSSNSSCASLPSSPENQVHRISLK